MFLRTHIFILRHGNRQKNSPGLCSGLACGEELFLFNKNQLMIIVSNLPLKDEDFITYFYRFKTKKDFDFLHFIDRPFLFCPCFCDDIVIATFFDVVYDCVCHFNLHVLIARGEGDFLTPRLIRLGFQ